MIKNEKLFRKHIEEPSNYRGASTTVDTNIRENFTSIVSDINKKYHTKLLLSSVFYDLLEYILSNPEILETIYKDRIDMEEVNIILEDYYV